MIDTIRFAIPIKTELYDAICKKCVVMSKHDNTNGKDIYRVFRTDLKLGSYDRNINVFISDKDPSFAKLEFSVPKYYYGHNVYLLYVEKLPEILEELWNNLVKYFGDFPHWSKWHIKRLDICYNWRFQNEEVATQVLSTLSAFEYPQKLQNTYGTSIMYKGTSYSLKWYLKFPEFYVHDFKYLLDQDLDYAYFVDNLARGVLRFEVTLRYKALTYWLDQARIIRVRDITPDFVLGLAQKYFNKFFRGVIPQFMNSQDVLTKLLTLYKPEKARVLYLCYISVTSKDKQQHDIYKRLVPSRYTRSYHMRELKKAQVGLSDSEFPFSFDFNIPSKHTTNPSNIEVAGKRPDGGY